MSFFRYLYLAYFSQPAAERFLYRGLRKWGCRSIVELGIGQGLRTQRLLEQAVLASQGQKIRYTGIDLFEARSESQPGLKLKVAHQQLQHANVRVQLVPGDPHMALSRVANTLRETDLLLVHADQDVQKMSEAWFYVPRMLHEKSRVFIERPGERGPEYVALTVTDVRRLAERAQRDERERRAA